MEGSEPEHLLVVVGDSLPFPRKDIPQRISDTWPQRLNQGDVFDSLWFMAMGGSLAGDVLERLSNALQYLPERVLVTVVVSQGIVDATPRPFPKLLEEPLKRFEALIQKAFGLRLRLKKRRILYKWYGQRWTSTRRFQKLVRQIFRLVESDTRVRHLFWLNILEPGPYLSGIVGEFSVKKYNRILMDEATKTTKCVFFTPKLSAIHTDGHHLTTKNHQEISSQILTYLKGARPGEPSGG